MGLDMYLNAKKYVERVDWKKSQKSDGLVESPLYARVRKAIGFDGFDEADGVQGIEVSFPVGYWRKANAIHSWFVANVQDGKDDCGSYYVTREHLQALKVECMKALELAPAIVETPVMAGGIPEREMMSENPMEAFAKIFEHIQVQTHEAEFQPEKDGAPLPPASGFFFGSAKRDEYWLECARYTLELTEKCLSMDERISFEYQSSW
jgi:hypothetical protein